MAVFKNKAANLYGYFVADFKTTTGDEVVGTCPLCKSENHFYMNVVKAAFSCKKCHEEGNSSTFLELLYKTFLKSTTRADLMRFMLGKKIPLPILQEKKLAFHANKFFLPAYDANFNVVDLRNRPITTKERSLKGASAGIVGLADLKGGAGDKVFITEGYTDYLALSWLFKRLDKPWKVVSFPGCNVCRPEWAKVFRKYGIVICYDNDPEAQGEYDENTQRVKGAYKVASQIGQSARSIEYLVWPEDTPPKFDVCDLVTKGIDNPSKTFDTLMSYIKPKHSDFYRHGATNDIIEHTNNPYAGSIITGDDIVRKTDEYAELNDNYRNAIKVGLATAISQHLPGSNNVFTLLVGPVASGKTLITGAYETSSAVVYESTLTSTALISGWGLGQSSIADPSIMSKVNNRCLVLKDLTEVFSNEMEAKMVFSIIRGAYDGVAYRTFGTGKRSYITNMSFLGGVTDAIRSFSDSHLGNRFLMYQLIPTPGKEEAIQDKAINMELFGGESLADLQDMTDAFLCRDWEFDSVLLNGKIPNWFKVKLKPLARLVALLKSQVQRIQFGHRAGQIINKAQPETGNRIAVQFIKLALGLAIVDQKDFVDEEIYSILHKIAYDTVDGYQTDLVMCLLQCGVPLSVDNIAKITNIPDLWYRIDDAKFLNLIEPIHRGSLEHYQPTRKVRDLWKRSKL